jgi:hypothetical protein
MILSVVARRPVFGGAFGAFGFDTGRMIPLSTGPLLASGEWCSGNRGCILWPQDWGDGMKHFFKLAAVVLLVAGAQSAVPQSDNNHIRSGAKVFVETMDGFGDNFVAALHTKQVPVVVVTDKDKADFFFGGYCNIFGDRHIEANIKAVNKDGTVVFAYDYQDAYPIHGKQSAAEACAKNLKKNMVVR